MSHSPADGSHMVRRHKDKYGSFQELARNEREGKDFRILMEDRDSGTTVLAPHGGKIESGTSEIAKAIAGRDFNLYCFEGMKRNRNHTALHIASHRFNEPKCLLLLSHSSTVLVIHGCEGDREEVFVGGRNKTLRRIFAQKLQESGLIALENRHSFPGEEEHNICNRGVTGEGIQFELTAALRNGLAVDQFVKSVRNTILTEQTT